MESIKKASRKEKFKYLKAKGFKCKATMTNKQLDELIDMDDPSKQKDAKIKGRKDGRKRVPLGHYRSKMSTEGLDIDRNKVVPRWINDVGGRIRDALDGGYQFVEDPEKAGVGEDPLQSRGMGNAVNMRVGTKEDGTPQIAYLMTIDKDLYEEDQAYKQAQVDEIDDAIQKGTHQSDYHDGKYIPAEGIKIKR